jgi:NAD(P)-dependent dehydrogenase (short-subunit alcohol dehydrogenase family)
MEPARLDGQVAIVTGAGRGVGRVIAERLAAVGAGVAVVARSADQIAEVASSIGDAGGRAEAIPADVTDERAVETLLERVRDELGTPALLVNNAGSWSTAGPVEESDPGAWWNDVEVSLRGTFLCVRAVLPDMLAAGEGRIVNVSSGAAVSPQPFMTAYASAKAAVLRFTDSLAAELEGRGVLAFAITPGFVRTELVEEMAASPAGRRYLPRLADRRDSLEPNRAATLVAEIASGRLDPLAGRFLHVLEDMDGLLRRADEIRERDLYALRLRTPE